MELVHKWHIADEARVLVETCAVQWVTLNNIQA